MEQKKNPRDKNRICIPTKDGFFAWIPKSRLDAWESAEHPAPLTPQEKIMSDKIVSMLMKREFNSPSHPSGSSGHAFFDDNSEGDEFEYDRPPNPPEPPIFSVEEELRETQRLLDASKKEIASLNDALNIERAICQNKISDMKHTMKSMCIVFIIFACFLVILFLAVTTSKHDGARGSNSYVYQSSYSSPYETVAPTRNEPIAEGYIGNIASRRYHKSTCAYLPDPENQVVFSSREDAEKAGYEPCRRCNP